MKLLKTTLESELNNLHIYDSEDLLNHLPYRYESFEYTDEFPLLDKNRYVLYGTIISRPIYVRAKNIKICSFSFASNEGVIYQVKAFNQDYLMKVLKVNEAFSLIASYSKKGNYMSLIKIKKGKIKESERLKPVYHLNTKISQDNFHKLIKRTLENQGAYFNNIIPSYLNKKYKLIPYVDALNKVHFPTSYDDIALGLRTLKFIECLDFSLTNKLIRDENKKLVKHEVQKIDLSKLKKFISSLPYELTRDQKNAVNDIYKDLNGEHLMYRLLQGDVGSGKTLVSLLALYTNYLRNKQGVMLAPTDSLARQHYLYFKDLLKDEDIEVLLLVGSLSNKEKKQIKEVLLTKTNVIVVGTHAVFSKSISYLNLGLAIIDEQHRFGVNQRNLLASKGDSVDILLMSATPIPRTLSMSLYGDLDVSSLHSYPFKERKVKTLVVNDKSPKINSLIDYAISKNRQVFIVCPKILEGATTLTSANEIYQKYKEKYGDNIELLHGKMDENKASDLIARFKNKEFLILVATSIVELGIDVKEALGIIIFSANNFGLASLHQLRGRVGRNGEEAFCLLVYNEETSEEKIERLKFLETTSDGFKIAEQDMLLRGPGDYLGIEQSGFPTFNSLNIVSDYKMFEVSKNEINYILENESNLENSNYINRIKEKMIKKASELSLIEEI